jgi:tol-pal system protein YbgF
VLAEEPPRELRGDGEVRTASRFAARLLAIAAALSLGACVSGSDIERLQRQISGVEKKVDALSSQASSREEVQKLSDNLGKQSTALLRANAEIGTKFDDLIRDMQTLAGKLEDSNRRLREVSQQLAEMQARAAGAAAASGATGATAAPAAARTASPADLYAQATADYQRGQFDLARQGFQEYLDSYPKTDLSDDAAYWIGECYAAQKKSREAIAAWERLFKQYPESDKAAAAHLKKGIAHLDLGEKAQAIVEMQFVVHEHPRSDEAKSARQRLKALGADVR